MSELARFIVVIAPVVFMAVFAIVFIREMEK